MIETIELNKNTQINGDLKTVAKDNDSLLKQRKSTFESDSAVQKSENEEIAATKVANKDVDWPWEFDWWLIIYLTTIHVCGIYGIYRVFFSSWLTILFSKLYYSFF